MDHELRDLYQGYHDERRAMNDNTGPCGPGDPHDRPGFDRATGIDDPVPDAEYGDDRAEPTLGYPDESGEEQIELPIPDGAEYDIDDTGDGRIIVQWCSRLSRRMTDDD